ncbi:MAG: LysR family transcriptional regulator, partial [Pirellulales bacterium]
MPRPSNLSFELLETFVKLIENGGDAATTAKQLDINQPSMSKRLGHLQISGPVLARPWLVREGKTWKLTAEGQKSLPAVRDLIKRYEQLKTFVEEVDRPDVSFACGRQSAMGFVRVALSKYRQKHADSPVRISTLRGQARIEGVASGSLDLATVTHDEPTINTIARRDLHIETIATHRLALVCGVKSAWAAQLAKLPKTKAPLTALEAFPLILPEADAGVRAGLDELLRKHALLNRLKIQLEIGGWRTILEYVVDGMGVGLVA